MQYQHRKHTYFHISIVSHVQYIAEYCHTLQSSTVVLCTNNYYLNPRTDSYYVIERFSYQTLLQLLIAHMCNDAVLCLL